MSDGKLMLDDKIGVKVRRYINDASLVGKNESDVFSAMSIFVEYVFDKDNVYNDFQKEEMNEWLESLSQTQFRKLIEFFENVPKLAHTCRMDMSRV